MKNLKKLLSLRAGMLVMLMGIMALGFTSCKKDDSEPAPTQTVYEILSSKSELSNLKVQIDSAGLDAALKADGNITLFAPSNQALTQLLTTLGLTSFDPVAKDIVQAVLTYHVANSEYLSNNLPASITTLQGEDITVSGGKLVSGASSDASIETADIKATNGVVHIIDAVLVPPSIGQVIVANLGKLTQPILLGKDFTTLKAAIAKADTYADSDPNIPSLMSVLADESSQKTVFAPVNAVFEQAGITLDSYTGQQWYGIIANHVVPGMEVKAADIQANDQYTTAAVGTKPITVLATNSPNGNYTGIFLDSNGDATPEAEVAQGDAFDANNGVLHAIAGILVPAAQ